MSRTVTFTQARSQFTTLVDRLQKHHEPVMVTRNGRPAAVLMSLDAYEALHETLEVLSDPQAIEDLRLSQRDVRAGRVYRRDDLIRRRRRA